MLANTWAPIAIPRWQWRSFAVDLAWLVSQLSTATWVESRPATETHLVCAHSLHHAWLAGPTLELEWRKEVGAEGFELWDTILRTAAPIRAASLERLYSAWGLVAPEIAPEGVEAAALLAGPIASTPAVTAVEVVRHRRRGAVDGIACCLESVAVAPSLRLESVALEHEDPSLLAQLIGSLGLDSLANTNFLQGLRHGLGLAEHAPERRTWVRR